MKIVFIGLEFSSSNKGCEALAYSFASILLDCCKSINCETQITAVVYWKYKENRIPHIDKKMEYVEIRPKKLSFWSKFNRVIRESDLVFDFTAGDSFTDMYGLKRFVRVSLLKQIVIINNKKLVLAPQTYGPYRSHISRCWASLILKNAYSIYARDEMSYKVVKKLCKREVKLTTDVAFLLPFNKAKSTSNKIKIGLNPSGLLWNKSGTDSDKFKLRLNYNLYIIELINSIYSQKKYEIHLIPHVWSNDFDANENDLYVSMKLKELYPDLILASDLDTPIDAKSYISGMDIFIGSRMHATIAAISTGVATIAVSYSRKFEGLFQTIYYPYVISGKDMNNEIALSQTLEWIKDYKKLLEETINANKISKRYSNEFVEDLIGLLEGSV